MKSRNDTSKNYLSLSIIALSLLFFSTAIFAAGQWKPAAALLKDAPAKQVMVQVEKQSNTLIALNYAVPAVSFIPVSYQNAARCALGNARLYSEPGKPEVPYIYSRIVVPYGRAIQSIRVIAGDIVELTGSHVLSYGEIQHPIGSKTVVWSKPDAAIYGSDAAFPGKTHELTSIQYRCGVAIAYINIFPLAYYPKSGKISYFKSFSLEVTLKADVSGGTDVKIRPGRILKGKITEENPGMVNTYPVARDNAPDYRYLLIAPNSFINASTTPNISDLIEQRESQGFTCQVESYDNIGGDETDLREFIKGYYTNNNTEFVCLVGDPGSPEIIPCYMVGSEASDLPLQCLDQGIWSSDYEAEVFIGRISAEDEDEAANQIYKILAYENNSGIYWTTGLSLGEELDASTYGKEAMQELASFFDLDLWSWQDLHDKDGDWNKSELIEIINSDEISVINHLGHSNTSYNMKLSNGNESQFTNTDFIFCKSQGCIPGKFQSDCIAERFTTENRNGFFAGVWNSNYGYYSPGDPTGGSSHQVHRAFWKACWEQDMEYFGEFNEYSHRTCTNYKKDIVESNLFGCPAIKFRGRNVDPFINVAYPNGGEELEQGTTQTISWKDNIDGNVMIDLLKGNSLKETLASSTASTGSFTWQIAGNYQLGTDYKIRITAVDSTPLFDESNATFSITEEYIIKQFPYIEDFDNLTSDTEILPKKWDQTSRDDLNWIVLNGPTPSKVGSDPDKTGPDNDHTSGSGNYIYVEASGDNSPDKQADFTTCKIGLNHLTGPELSFYYHMFSATNEMGDLYLDISVDGNWTNDVLHLTNDNGDQWIEQKLDLNPYIGERVIFRFRAITGDSWCSDICIDDFMVDGQMAIDVSNTNVPKYFDLKFYNSRIYFMLPENRDKVNIALYNLQGKLVRTLVNDNLKADHYAIPVNKLATGLYLCKIKTKGFTKTIRVLLKR